MLSLNPIALIYIYIFISSFFWLLAGIDESNRLYVYGYLLSPLLIFLYTPILFKKIVLDKYTTVPLFLILYIFISFLFFTPYWLSIDNLASLYRLLIFPIIFLISYHVFKIQDESKLVNIFSIYLLIALLSKVLLVLVFDKFYGGGANAIIFLPVYLSIFVLIYGSGIQAKPSRYALSKLFGISLMLLLILLVTLSFKRMQILLMVLGIFMIITFFYKNKQIWLFMALMFLGISVILLQNFNFYELINRFDGIVKFIENPEQVRSGYLRLQENLSVTKTLESLNILSFITGLGPGAEYDATSNALKVNLSGRRIDIHSMYFYLLFNLGVIGLLMYLFIPLRLIFRKTIYSVKKHKNLYYLIIGVKVTLILQFLAGITSNAFFGNPILAILAGWLASTQNKWNVRNE